jgi:hypothetical protein
MRTIILLTLSCASAFAADITGTGRPVIGKMLLPSPMTNPASQMPRVMICDAHQEFAAQMSPDGTFRLGNVTPGTWYLLADILSFPKGGGNAITVATAGKTFVVPEMSSSHSNEPLDLGTIEPVVIHSPQIGEAAPILEVKTTDGGNFKLSDHRGQYVLLDFELMSFLDNTNQSVQAVWDAFGKNDRLAMLTLKVPLLSGVSVYFAGHEPQYSWPQAQLFEVPWYESKRLRASYGLQTDRVDTEPNLPAIILVGTDGKIVAKDLHGDDIKAAVAKALGN